MNFNITKDIVDSRYNHLFVEKLYNTYISANQPKDYFSSPFSFYVIEDLNKKIIATFGNPKDTLNYNIFCIESNKFEVAERAFIYDGFLLCLKSKLSSYNYSPSIYDDDDDTEETLEDTSQIRLDVFSDGSDSNLAEKLSTVVSKTTEIKRKKNELSILCYNSMEGFYLKKIKTIKTELDLEDNYNSDFVEASNHIIERLNTQDDKGIVLLHGMPGTGKTSYIRSLTKEITDKNIIYIPPDFAANISNPEFVVFFLSHANSILIIEDAENILKSRKAGGNQAVSNLLSLSDGLLGDGLKLQVVCTFNSDITQIDDALLREGRLIAEYKFDKLTVEKSQKLLDKVYKEKGEDAPIIDKPMTIAEIFNHKDKRFISSKKESSIGFKR